MAKAFDTSLQLWRYIPLYGLIDLLQSKKLHFTRADLFEDKFEGNTAKEIYREVLGQEKYDLKESDFEMNHRSNYVSCWHKAISESVAMWRLYGRDNSAVAIVTTSGKFLRLLNRYCVESDLQGLCGEVIYRDKAGQDKFLVSATRVNNDSETTSLAETMHYLKGSAFEYEKEWRVIVHDENCESTFIKVPISNLQHFIEKIVVSPEAPEWILNSIVNLVHVQFGYAGIKVERSQLVKHFLIG